jgi:Serine phosphatase RsbU, regulator of sigma subunit
LHGPVILRRYMCDEPRAKSGRSPLAKVPAGPAMGLIPNAQFKTTQAKLAEGDFLLFFTDGVVEAEDKAGSDFGIEGLRQSIRSNLDQPTESLSKPLLVTFTSLPIRRS